MRMLFVCLGNICRSPTAEGVVRKLAADAGVVVDVDSCGTGGWHVGDPPDPRTVAHAHRRGYDLSTLRARQLAAADFVLFDRVFAMDQEVLRAISGRCPELHRHKLDLFLGADFGGGRDVPDPYSGGPDAFEEVLDLVEARARLLIASLKR